MLADKEVVTPPSTPSATLDFVELIAYTKEVKGYRPKDVTSSGEHKLKMRGKPVKTGLGQEWSKYSS